MCLGQHVCSMFGEQLSFDITLQGRWRLQCVCSLFEVSFFLNSVCKAGWISLKRRISVPKKSL